MLTGMVAALRAALLEEPYMKLDDAVSKPWGEGTSPPPPQAGRGVGFSVEHEFALSLHLGAHRGCTYLEEGHVDPVTRCCYTVLSLGDVYIVTVSGVW